MSAPESHYKAKYPRTYEASFVALSMVDGRELWCVGRDVCADLEGQHAALLSQVARLREGLKSLIGPAEQDLRDAKAMEHIAPQAFALKKKRLDQARALLAETEGVK